MQRVESDLIEHDADFNLEYMIVWFKKRKKELAGIESQTYMQSNKSTVIRSLSRIPKDR